MQQAYFGQQPMLPPGWQLSYTADGKPTTSITTPRPPTGVSPRPPTSRTTTTVAVAGRATVAAARVSIGRR
ncbi:hypothetical_protein_-_conserved [Leishmania infantum]|uniref:Hypothetical_protein_-_conserved n=1 Tax=Leishmania infantum TaxID=5671 RepID=A0A6L0XGC9_LEIIN|nr:hypothetical_protein_-_conserved [Leishmania infantum]SUZ42883.1 hypothetical_protein_-_conserved [Leishmania infantum]